eukprot:GHVL01014692.1.p1 GENE.GHVL01014692.1~~GHVL01014692.1.p1  ORF type:complete len:181 (+),score=30.62 GHVL01014692.1:32-574(+)
MSLFRQLNKQISVLTKNKKGKELETWKPQNSNTWLRRNLEKYLCGPLFTYLKAPVDRVCYAEAVKAYRTAGLMCDDTQWEHDPVVQRALLMLPYDMACARYRRIARCAQLDQRLVFLPMEEQNYDPMVPYLAPYIEEAKFQMQEEEELLGFYPMDRRLYQGDTTGFGDKDGGHHLTTWIF